MTELPRGVRGHTYIVMITIFFEESWAFFFGGGGKASTPQIAKIEPCQGGERHCDPESSPLTMRPSRLRENKTVFVYVKKLVTIMLWL